MLNLKFIEVDSSPIKPKATIHYSGRLGFSSEAIKFMNLENNRAFKVAVSDNDGTAVKNLYLIEDKDVSGVAKVSKAGEYYYLNVGTLFEDLGFDYKNYTIIFDIKKELYEGKNMFILKRRAPMLRNKKKEDFKEDI